MASSRDKLRKKAQEKKSTPNTTRNTDAFDAVIEREQKKNIIINPILKSLIPPLQEEELEILEQSIREEGVREDIILWKDKVNATNENDFILVDGHNRYHIVQKIESEGGNVKYGVKLIDLPDFESVKDWMIINQLGRRNLTNEQRSYLRGLRYEREKSKHGGDRKPSPQNGNLKTHEKLSEEYSVSKNTILRDAEFARGLEKIGLNNSLLKQNILAGKEKVKKSDIQEIAKLESPALNFESGSQLSQSLKKLKQPKPSKIEKTDNKFDSLKNTLTKEVKALSEENKKQKCQKLEEIIMEIKQL